MKAQNNFFAKFSFHDGYKQFAKFSRYTVFWACFILVVLYVVYSDNFWFVPGELEKDIGAAYGSYDDTVNTNGWAGSRSSLCSNKRSCHHTGGGSEIEASELVLTYWLTTMLLKDVVANLKHSASSVTSRTLLYGQYLVMEASNPATTPILSTP